MAVGASCAGREQGAGGEAGEGGGGAQARELRRRVDRDDDLHSLSAKFAYDGGHFSHRWTPAASTISPEEKAKREKEERRQGLKGPPMESAAEMRARYTKTLAAQESALEQQQKQYATSLLDHRQAYAGANVPYAGEMGPGSYRSDQLDAFRVCKTIALDIVKEILDQFDDGGRPGPSIPQLTQEYASWQKAHERLQKKLAREEAVRKKKEEKLARSGKKGKGGAADSSSSSDEMEVVVEAEEEAEDGKWKGGPGGDDDVEGDDDESLHRLVGLHAPLALAPASLAELTWAVIGSLVRDQCKALSKELLQEKKVAATFSRRLLLGSAIRVAADDTAAQAGPQLDPAAREELVSKQLKTLCKQRGAKVVHRHSLSVTQQWRGKRPKKPRKQLRKKRARTTLMDDSSDSSSSSDDDGGGGGLGGGGGRGGGLGGRDEKVDSLKLNDRPERPPFSALRAAFMEREGHYWAAVSVQTTFVHLKESGTETPPNGYSIRPAHARVSASPHPAASAPNSPAPSVPSSGMIARSICM